jgi:hypothetical protein
MNELPHRYVAGGYLKFYPYFWQFIQSSGTSVT